MKGAVQMKFITILLSYKQEGLSMLTTTACMSRLAENIKSNKIKVLWWTTLIEIQILL